MTRIKCTEDRGKHEYRARVVVGDSPDLRQVRPAEGEREAVEPNVRSCRPEKAQGLESQPRSNRLEKGVVNEHSQNQKEKTYLTVRELTCS